MTDRHKKLREQTTEIAAMTDEEKGRLLLDCVRNVAWGTGEDEDEMIVLLSEYRGIIDGFLAAYVNYRKELEDMNSIERHNARLPQ